MVTVTPGARADLDALVELLTRAFLRDPVFEAMLGAPIPTQPARARHLHRATVLGPLAAGTIDLARDDQGKVLGAAIWHAPHRRGAMDWGRLAQVPDYLRAFGASGLRRAARVIAAFDACRPAEPHWYLEDIAVGEEARGQGLGSVLLNHRLSRIDRLDEPAFLEATTSRSAKLYSRHGFTVLHHVDLGPHFETVTMWRPPASQAERH